MGLGMVCEQKEYQCWRGVRLLWWSRGLLGCLCLMRLCSTFSLMRWQVTSPSRLSSQRISFLASYLYFWLIFLMMVCLFSQTSSAGMLRQDYFSLRLLYFCRHRQSDDLSCELWSSCSSRGSCRLLECFRLMDLSSTTLLILPPLCGLIFFQSWLDVLSEQGLPSGMNSFWEDGFDFLSSIDCVIVPLLPLRELWWGFLLWLPAIKFLGSSFQSPLSPSCLFTDLLLDLPFPDYFEQFMVISPIRVILRLSLDAFLPFLAYKPLFPSSTSPLLCLLGTDAWNSYDINLSLFITFFLSGCDDFLLSAYEAVMELVLFYWAGLLLGREYWSSSSSCFCWLAFRSLLSKQLLRIR